MVDYQDHEVARVVDACVPSTHLGIETPESLLEFMSGQRVFHRLGVLDVRLRFGQASQAYLQVNIQNWGIYEEDVDLLYSEWQEEMSGEDGKIDLRPLARYLYRYVIGMVERVGDDARRYLSESILSYVVVTTYPNGQSRHPAGFTPEEAATTAIGALCQEAVRHDLALNPAEAIAALEASGAYSCGPIGVSIRQIHSQARPEWHRLPVVPATERFLN